MLILTMQTSYVREVPGTVVHSKADPPHNWSQEQCEAPQFLGLTNCDRKVEEKKKKKLEEGGGATYRLEGRDLRAARSAWI